jgi:hypothetical protein
MLSLASFFFGFYFGSKLGFFTISGAGNMKGTKGQGTGVVKNEK